MPSEFSKKIKKLDKTIALKWNGVGGKGLTYVLKTFSFFGRETFWFFLIAFFLFIWYDPYPFVYIGATFMNGLIFVLPLKQGLKRERPFNKIEGVELFEQEPTSKSFPSWHSYNVASQGLMLSYLLNSLIFGMIFMIIAVLVAFSRIQLGVHYFSDVVTGFCLGMISFILVVNIMGPFFLWSVFNLEQIAIHDVYYQSLNPSIFSNLWYFLTCTGVFGGILFSAIFKNVKKRIQSKKKEID